ncbi:hypothetical protein [Aeromicrobium sp. CTD01-1L150]|uniref:hypothetical protein n=1 Tax=Aeromicrobium sp. CTD01-1L150 TaxID=3341830 RepID=UPI0035C1B161
MPEPLDAHLDNPCVDPVILEELMLLTEVMIATRREQKPLRQDTIDLILGIEPCPGKLAS